MKKQALRVACAALSERILAGTPSSDGTRFIGNPVDVTSDCLKAVIEKVGDNCEVDVCVDGKLAYTIAVRRLTSPEGA